MDDIMTNHSMQYFTPPEGQFVSDCMPFYHDGIFRLYYLLDENHHASVGGLGGHQWAQASTCDLIHWEHHPLAIPITQDYEGSICTGSVFYQDGKYYGFYATRRRDWTQHLSLAVSDDGIHFSKVKPNLASPPAGYDPVHYRDPVVFQDGDGLFHLLCTARLLNCHIPERSGCLAHLVSNDLLHWENLEPFIVPGLPGVPECPDFFEWNGWQYIIFSNDGIARYRMRRRLSKSQATKSPSSEVWIRPKVDMLDGPAARVMKTAAFGENRHLGVAWLGTRKGNKDRGDFQFGGNVIFRELVQHDDGSLGLKFPTEMTPVGKPISSSHLTALNPGSHIDGDRIHLTASQGFAAVVCSDLPQNLHMKLRILPQPGATGFGLRLRASETLDSGYELHFSPSDHTVRLNEQMLYAVDGLDQPFDLEVVLLNDIIDVCIDKRRTLIDRCPEQRGDRLFVYSLDSRVDLNICDKILLIHQKDFARD